VHGRRARRSARELARQALALVDQVESRHPVSAMVRFEEVT